MRRLVTRLQAQLEVEDAVAWYEGKRPGLGSEFLAELDSLLERIAASPFQFPEVGPRIRRGLLKHFPIQCTFR